MAEKSTVTQKELGKRLGLSTRQIHNLVEHGLQRTLVSDKPEYPWPESLHWYLQFKLAAANSESKSEKAKNDELRRRQLEAEVRMSELELGIKEGQLVTIDYMEQQMSAMLQRLAAKMRNLSGKWAPTMVGVRSITEAQARLEPAVAEAMEALMETGEDPELDEEEDDDDPAPDARKGKK